MSTTAGKGISDSHYARRTRELNKLITELRALSAQTEVDFPRTPVIRNQSAGKRSLVAAIAGYATLFDLTTSHPDSSHYNRHADSCSKIKWNMHK
ncbi:hypothetical protein FRC02_004684, partial [Tulasnella sp. 418]